MKKEVRKRDKPCRNHGISYPSDDIPEVKNLRVIRCRKCKWFVKATRPRLYRRGVKGVALHNLLNK